MLRAVLALALLAFANTPVSHTPREEPRMRQLDRAFFVDSMQRLAPMPDIDVFPRETAAPLYDSPTHRLYVGTRDGRVRCLIRPDAKTRRDAIWELQWTALTRGPVLATPLLDKETLYVGSASGELMALNRYTGQPRWSAEIKEELTTTPTLADGRLYVMSSEEAVTAVTLEGKPVWKFRREPPAGFTIRGNARPVVAHNLLYAAFADGNVAALSLDAGVAKWMRNASGTGDYLDVDSIAAPEDDKLIYAASAKAGVVALNALTGEPVWTYALPGANHVIVDGARIYATGRGAAVALSRLDGKKLWQLPLGNDRYATAPAVADNLLLFTLERGALLAVDTDTGRARGAFEPGSGFSQGPLAMRGAALIVTNEGALLTLGLLP